MTELDPRQPHERRWKTPDGRVTVAAVVDHRGIVEITEEALAQLCTAAGWTEVNA
jgi:hypothetical protein